MGAQQRDIQESLAFLQLKEREANLRLRNLPELEEGSLKDYIVKEFSVFWQLEEKDLQTFIVKAYRFGAKGKKNPKRVNDCMAILQDRFQRDQILDLHYKNNLVVHHKKVIIYKDIPRYFLNLRLNYNDLSTALRLKNIPFSWEFPQGLTFKYRDRRIRIKSFEDKKKFLDRYAEDFKAFPGNPVSEIPAKPEEKESEEEDATASESEEELQGATGGTDE